MGKVLVSTHTLASIGIWTICLAGYPFCMKYAFGYPFMIPLLVGLTLLFLLLVVKNIHCGTLKSYRIFNYLFITMLLFWLLQMIFRTDIGYVSNLFQVSCIFVIYLAVINFITIDTMAKQYVNFMIANCIGGTLITILLLIHSFPPLFQYVHHNGLVMANFYYLTFTNVAYDLGGLTIIRYSGLFDEPGAVSLYCMFALLLNKLLIKSKRNEILLIFLPMFTFSLAHFATVVVYFILFYIKKISTVFFIVIFFASTYCLLEFTKETEYGYLYKLTLGRLQKNDTGRISGDNRTELNENSLFFFKEEPLTGKGKTFFEDKVTPIGGIFYYGALYGIFGYIFIYLFLYYAVVLCLFKRKKLAIWGDGMKTCIVIFVNLFQRPDMTNIFQMFSLILFVLCVLQSINCSKNRNEIYLWKKNHCLL